MAGKYEGGYYCPWCEKYEVTASGTLRRHVAKHHLEVTPEELERHIVLTRYPDLDLDALVELYRNKLDTIMLQQQRGLFVKKYFRTIGLMRNWRADLNIQRYLKPGMTTEAEVKKAMADALVNKFRQASPEVRFQGYLNRDLARLRNDGQEELVPAVRALKIIRFAQKQVTDAIDEALKEAQAANPIVSETEAHNE
jgi:hypothetical protein